MKSRLYNIILNNENPIIKLEYILISISFLVLINLLLLYNTNINFKNIKFIKMNVLSLLSFILLCISFEYSFLISSEDLISSIESEVLNSFDLQLILQISWIFSTIGCILSMFSSNPLLGGLFPLCIINIHGYLISKWSYAKINSVIFDNTFLKWTKIVNPCFIEEKLNDCLTIEFLHQFDIPKDRISDFLVLYTDEIYSQTSEEIKQLFLIFNQNVVKAEESALTTNTSLSSDCSTYINSTTINLILILIIMSLLGFGAYKIYDLLSLDWLFRWSSSFSNYLFGVSPVNNSLNNPLSKDSLILNHNDRIAELALLLKSQAQKLELLQRQQLLGVNRQMDVERLVSDVLIIVNKHEAALDSIKDNLSTFLSKEDFNVIWNSQLTDLQNIHALLEQLKPLIDNTS